MDRIGRATFVTELVRSIPAGVLETVTNTFAILIAERVFHASNTAKELSLMGGRGGLVASFAVVWLLARFQRPLSQLIGALNHAGALFFLIATVFADNLWAFVIGVSFGMFWFGFQTPLLTAIYQDNYPDRLRGQLYSLTSLTRSGATLVFSWLGGKWLETDLGRYRWMLAIFTVCSVLSGWLLWKIPCRRIGISDERVPFWRAFRWLQIDSSFRFFLIAYMIMGLGNLIMNALFVDYLVNPDYGFALGPAEVAWLTGAVPMIFKLLSAYPWGILFDRANFIVLRLVLNLLFAASILVFFLGKSYAMWWAGSALLGLAFGGGNVVWNLWVTKLAPPDRVAEYMSIHTFLTGFRGLLAPMLAFSLAGKMSVPALSWLCVAMILGSTALLLPEWKKGRVVEEPPPLEEA